VALFDDAEMRASRVSRMVLHEVGPNDRDFKLFNGTLEPGEMQDFFLDRLVTANKGSAYVFGPDSALLASLRGIKADTAALEDVGKRIATSFNELHRGNVNAGTLAIFELRSETRSVFAVLKFDSQSVVSVDEGADAHARLRLLRKTIVESKSDAAAKVQKLSLLPPPTASPVRSGDIPRQAWCFWSGFAPIVRRAALR
jgi:hypothetical protein